MLCPWANSLPWNKNCVSSILRDWVAIMFETCSGMGHDSERWTPCNRSLEVLANAFPELLSSATVSVWEGGTAEVLIVGCVTVVLSCLNGDVEISVWAFSDRTRFGARSSPPSRVVLRRWSFSSSTMGGVSPGAAENVASRPEVGAGHGT